MSVKFFWTAPSCKILLQNKKKLKPTPAPQKKTLHQKIHNVKESQFNLQIMEYVLPNLYLKKMKNKEIIL